MEKTPPKTPARDAADDLALIRSMMEAGRQRAGIDGSHLLIWGAILTFAFAAQYMAARGFISVGGLMIWIPAFLVGWSLSFYVGRKQGRPASGPNIALTAYSRAWFAVGITMVLHFGAAVVSGIFDPKTITVLACGIMAGAFFVIASVTQVKWLNGIAAGWWLVLITATVQESYAPEMLLLMELASAFLIIVPGLLLRRQARSESAASNPAV